MIMITNYILEKNLKRNAFELTGIIKIIIDIYTNIYTIYTNIYTKFLFSNYFDSYFKLINCAIYLLVDKWLRFLKCL